ncbi:MAG: DUF177 domain-containing protein [Thermaerobacter sp.]|nr:DUF177 domain-containing protein [Thermaerobacter sp.]
MDVRVSDVRKWAGREEFTRVVEPWPHECQARVEFPLINPADVRVRVRNTGGALVVEVSGEAECQAQCARCLEPFGLRVPFSAVEEFREEPGPSDPNGDYSRFTGDRLVLDDLVADAVGLGLPMVSVCSPQCRGLCPQCGVNWNQAPCECVPWPDDRLAGLRALLPPDRT